MLYAILGAGLLLAFVVIAWITQKGKMDFDAEYQRRQDDAKAERLVAQVRKELVAKNRADQSEG
jgi:hypothetical protein